MKRILLVEDEEDNMQILRDLLAPGYELVEADNGEKALAEAKQRPDLILMDIQLPIMDGYEATRRLKADPALRSVPIIAITSYALGQDEARARAAGCDDFVAKPYSPRVQFEYDLAGKWLELLKELAPNVTRVAMLREQGQGGIGQWAILQSTARTLGVEVKPIDLLREAALIERDITAFARGPNSGMVIAVSAASLLHSKLIVSLAARHRLPSVYPYRTFVIGGASYGTDIGCLYRRAAGYVDRILKREKPGDLPMQIPTKYDLVINLKTAKVLGLTVPPTLLARADEVIE